jgi:hypothetical protein
LVTIASFVQYSIKGIGMTFGKTYVDLQSNREKDIRQTYLNLRQDVRLTYDLTYDVEAVRRTPARAEIAQLFRLAATNSIAQTLEPCLRLGGARQARVIATRLCQPRGNWPTVASVRRKFDKLGRVERQL